MPRIAVILFIAIAFSAEADELPAKLDAHGILKTTYEVMRQAQTPRELIRKAPGFGPFAEAIHAEILGKVIDQKLPPPGFNLDKGTINYGEHTLKVINLEKGIFQFGDKEYTWNRTQNYYQNLASVLKLVFPQKKSASWMNLIMSEANAQNRGDFPQGYNEERSPTPANAAIMIGQGAGSLGLLYGTGAMFKDYAGYAVKSPAGLLLLPIAKVVSQVTGASMMVNLHSAYNAPSCDAQAEKLKVLMNETGISLKTIICKWGTFSQEQSGNISFWTPDGKMLPFYADWESSQLFVDRNKEIYHFGYDKLNSVTVNDGEKIVDSGAELEAYRKKLEPYRRVLFQIGQYNSCWRCGRDFQKLLGQKAPGKYTTFGTAQDSATSK